MCCASLRFAQAALAAFDRFARAAWTSLLAFRLASWRATESGVPFLPEANLHFPRRVGVGFGFSLDAFGFDSAACRGPAGAAFPCFFDGAIRGTKCAEMLIMPGFIDLIDLKPRRHQFRYPYF